MVETKAVLEWLKEAFRVVDENPTQENIGDLLVQAIQNKEEIKDAVTDALRPELRDLAETISKVLAGGF